MRVRQGTAAIFAIVAACALSAPAHADGPLGYQSGPDHTGAPGGTSVAPPLGRVWVRRDLGGSVSYPVIAEGKAFVAAGKSVYALDLATGNTVWSRSLATRGVAYDAGRVFAVDSGGSMQALSAATGEKVWSTELSGSGGEASPPTAYGDYVYTSGQNQVYGLRESDGLLLFSQSAATDDASIPAVDADKTYTTAGCAETSALQRTIGVEIWRYTGECTGGGSGIPVLRGGRVYTSDNASEKVLDAGSGALVDTVAGTGPPAFAGDLGIYRGENKLFARSESSGLTKWQLATTQSIVMPPLVAGGHVYALTGEGKLIAVDLASGAKVWEGDLHTGYASSSSGGTETPGMAASGDTLVVPAGNRLVALRPGSDSPGIDDPDKPPAGSSTITLKAARTLTVFRKRVLLTGEVTGSASGGAGSIEIQKDPWPYGSWEHARKATAYSGRFQAGVHPDRNTRYRAVYDVTAPVLVSPEVTLFADIYLRIRVLGHGRHRVLIKASLAGPADAGLRSRRVFVYHLPKRARLATRIGVLRPKGSATKAHAQGVFTPPSLHGSDLFFICRNERHDDGFGRPAGSLRNCGRRRLR